MRNIVFLMLIITLVLASSLQAQNNTERLEQLEELCRQQALEIEQLERNATVLENKETYKNYTQTIVKEYLEQPQSAEAQDGVTAGYDNGFFIRSADNNFELKMTGYVQMGLAIAENNTASENNTAYPAGVYLTFDVKMYEQFGARIQFDNWGNIGDNNTTSLRDAYLEWRPREYFNLRVGQTHVPFSIEGQYSEIEGMSIWSEPFTASWSHGRDPGILIYGVLDNAMEYKIGVFNGAGTNQANDGDDFILAYQTRYYFMGYKENANTFFHVGGIWGHMDGAYDTSLYGAGMYAQNAYNVDAGVTPVGIGVGGLFASAGEGSMAGLDVGLRYDKDMENGSNLRLETEFMYFAFDRDFDGSGNNLSWLHAFGFLAGASYRHCLNPEVEGSGLIMMLKYSYAEINNRNDDYVGTAGPSGFSNNITAQRLHTTTLGLGYAFNRHFAVNFNWIIGYVEDQDPMDFYTLDPNYGTWKNDDVYHSWYLQFTAAW